MNFSTFTFLIICQVLTIFHQLISRHVIMLAHGVYCKINFIGDHGTWVKCGPGPQRWSTFYPMTVRRSAFYQWPSATLSLPVSMPLRIL